MHAVVVKLTINDMEADLGALRGQVVPRMSRAPGFITGFWTRKANTGLSMIVFDSEDAATAATERVISGVGDVATLEDIEVREVIAHETTMSRALDVANGLIAAYNRADWERLSGLLAPDSLYDEVGSGRQARGRQEITELFRGWKQAMPDAEGTVTRAMDCGDTAVLEVTWKATFTRPWATPEGELEPTDRHHTSRGCIVATIEDDRIKEFRQYQDFMTLMQQLGLSTPATV